MKVLQIITDKVLETIKNGFSLPWVKPWTVSPPSNAITGKPYRGINYFVALFFGQGENLFLTYKQASEKGGQVKKGAKGLPILFFTRQGKGTFDAKGREETRPVWRYYTVFALRDVEGLEHLRPEAKPFTPIATADAIVARIDAPITHGGDVAGYYPSQHAIIMPPRESFQTPSHYYCTLFHEAIHATGKHLGHKLAENGHGVAYSKEELVAEMGAAMLANAAGVWCEVLEKQSVAYVAGWLKKLTCEPKYLIEAAREAQKRVDYLLGVQPATYGEASEGGETV